ncbi:MAG: carbamoyltransferase HypF [Phycisphaerales bacterium]|nr:carbamoyltransferase HypF [Phycisphaerales bacterium]
MPSNESTDRFGVGSALEPTPPVAPGGGGGWVRRGIELCVSGQVQGVGFRPFVYRIAMRLGLKGAVWNDASGVVIELFGDPPGLDEFLRCLSEECPPLARIEMIRRRAILGPSAPASFEIAESQHEGRPDRVAVDSATCVECLRELHDPTDRRFGHALVNCTNCGPRYTIVNDVPYDRPLTTMAGFAMCERCRSEYRDPRDRRFHAQPTCCPSCGPVLDFVGAGGGSSGDAIESASEAFVRGQIVAIKGLGGYHLAVDATNEAAVARLRAKKRRDHKPLALMVDSIETARSLVELSPEAERLLTSPAAPIVLATRRCEDGIACGVAPGMHRLGVMLPHTPIQHLLSRRGHRVLVMTSANLSDEPLISDDGDARTRLATIADAILTHDRPIARAVDDSIVLDAPLGAHLLRRARGFVPAPIRLPAPADRPGLCLGGELKSAVAISDGDHAVLSQHLGDLNHTLAFERFRSTIEDLLRLFRVAPAWIARDAHPGYLSHRYADTLGRRWGVPIVDVQHHHAHMAAALAEHGRTDAVVGLICDGVGYGSDGTSWGGEVLVGDLVSFRRVGRMRPLALPGGDAAAKQTGRCALSWLMDSLGPDAITTPIARRVIPVDAERDAIAAMLARQLNCPPSSGLGRLFDAAAALLGVCEFNHFEAMSGVRLEAIASGGRSIDGRHVGQSDSDSGPACVRERDGLMELDHRPLCRRLVRGLERGEPIELLARLFHEAVASLLATSAIRAARESSLSSVVLSGGVFCNAWLASLVHQELTRAGLEVLMHRRVPANDGGIALGQAAVAACVQRQGR